MIDNPQPAEDQLARVRCLPEPVERYIADAIALGVALVDVGLGGSANWDRGDGPCVETNLLNHRIVKMDLEMIKAGNSGQATLEAVSSLRLDSGSEHVRGVMQHGDDGFVRRPILIVHVDACLIAPDGIPCYRLNDRSLLGNLRALWRGTASARLAQRDQGLRKRGCSASCAQSFESIAATFFGLRLEPVKPGQLASFLRQVSVLFAGVAMDRANSAPESDIDHETVGLPSNAFKEQLGR